MKLTNKTKTAVMATLIPAVLIAGGCKGTTAPTGTAPAAAVDSSIDTSGLQPDAPDSPADAAPVDSTCPSANTTAFAKTKFVAHAGLAFGAFHQWIYKPMTAKPTPFGKGQPTRVRVMTFVKAGASALFVKREVRLAAQDAKASPALCKVLVAPLAAVGNKVQDAYARLRSGDTSGVTALQSSISTIESQAARAGDTITEPANTDPNSPAN